MVLTVSLFVRESSEADGLIGLVRMSGLRSLGDKFTLGPIGIDRL